MKSKKSKYVKILTISNVDEVSSTLIKESLNDNHIYAKEKLYSLVYDYIWEFNLYKNS